jgi:RNA polymerase sigma-70 factor (ECF subfamily)
MSVGDASRWQAEWERGRRTYPHVALLLAEFDAHLGSVAGPSAAPLAHAEDLYLACACARGLPAALAAFDALLNDVSVWVRRVDASPDFADEVRQRLRERLLLPPSGGGRPRIAEYNGAGTLRAWLRIAAARTALNLRRNRDDQPMAPLDLAEHQEPALAALSVEPELRALRGEHQDTLRQAMRDAFVWLSREERTALRLQYGARLTTERIATVLQVDRSTAVRRLAQARSRMLVETRRLLGERLRLSPPEVDSLIDALRESLELSLTDLLRTLHEDDPPPDGSDDR